MKTPIILATLFASFLSLVLLSGCKKDDTDNQITCPEKHEGIYKGTVTYFNGTVYTNIETEVNIVGSGSTAKMVLGYYLSPADTIYAIMNCTTNNFNIPDQTVGSCDFDGYGTISADGATLTYHIANAGSGCGPMYLDGTFVKL